MKIFLQNKDVLISLAFAIIGISVAFTADSYLLYVATSWLIFGILGLSLDLVWGKAGVLSLGHTIFFGLGGYTGAIVAINFYPIFGNTFLLALPVGMVIGAFISGIIGAIMFYSRMGLLQITILTYTLTIMFFTLTISFSTEIGEAIIGGDNGMSNIPEMILTFGKEAEGLSDRDMFLSVLALSLICLIFCQFIMKTHFGKIIECIRLDIKKTEFLGYDVRKYQTILFAISGALSGVAGSLFALWGNYLHPTIFSVQEALKVPIYVLIGGLGSLVGSFLGALGIGGLSFYMGGFSGGQATLVIGITLIFMVLFFDKGLVGLISYVIEKYNSKKEIEETSFHINIGEYKGLEKTVSKKLKTNKVYKSFGGVISVNNIDLEFNSGKVSCIIGPNGAGKSSYLCVCMGVYKTEHGNIYLDENDITQWSLVRRVQEGIGIKMQKPQVFKTFTVKENIWIAAYSRCKNKNEVNRITDETLKMLGNQNQGKRIVDTLSHGEQQWLDIAMVLSLSPSIIFFDEPAAGMTISEKKELSKLIVKISKHKVIILVEHDMDFIKSLDGMVTVLHQGKVFTNGSIESLHKDERVLDIYLGRKVSV